MWRARPSHAATCSAVTVAMQRWPISQTRWGAPSPKADTRTPTGTTSPSAETPRGCVKSGPSPRPSSAVHCCSAPCPCIDATADPPAENYLHPPKDTGWRDHRLEPCPATRPTNPERKARQWYDPRRSPLRWPTAWLELHRPVATLSVTRSNPAVRPSVDASALSAPLLIGRVVPVNRCTKYGCLSHARSPSGGGVPGEVPIQHRPAHTEALGDVLAGLSVGHHPRGGGDVLGVIDLAGQSELRAAGTKSRSLQGCSLVDQLTLVFGQRPQHADHHSASGSRRIDAVGRRHQGHAHLSQGLDGALNVEHVAPEPVELPHHHGVTGAQLIHQGRQIPSARHGVRVDLRCTSRLERIMLVVQHLGDGADPGVAEPHAHNRWADGPSSACHNVENRRAPPTKPR